MALYRQTVEDFSLYSGKELSEVEWKALQEAKANIDAETTTNSTQIDEFVEAGKAAMLAARDLDPYKNAAKEKAEQCAAKSSRATK